MQDRPICAKCTSTIEHSPIFEAPCGHEGCPSAVWHGLCLMEFYEEREKAGANRFEVIGVLVRPLMQEHTENG